MKLLSKTSLALLLVAGIAPASAHPGAHEHLLGGDLLHPLTRLETAVAIGVVMAGLLLMVAGRRLSGRAPALAVRCAGAGVALAGVMMLA